MKTSPLAGKPAQPTLLVDVPRLVTVYYSCKIDAESFRGADHHRRIQEQAQTIVGAVLAAPA